MDTAAISYRVADFLKKYPPFNSMDDADLLQLAAHGRVRFHEPHEYILWQHEALRPHVSIIQQGTVSLWDESGQTAALRDVRGAGDMLGIERFDGASTSQYSARSESDVVLYSFPSEHFAVLLATYPRARDYVNAEGHVSVDYHGTGERRDLGATFLHQLVAQKALTRCDAQTTVRDAAQRLLSGETDALAVLDEAHHLRGVLTATSFLDWVAHGAGGVEQRVERLLKSPPLVIGPDASVADGVLAMGGARAHALAITDDGTVDGRLHAVITSRDLGAVFGEQPVTLLQEIRTAANVQALRSLNHRVRAFALQQLGSAAAVDWVSRFTHLADVGIVRRLVTLAGGDRIPACWCFCGSSGRAESLTRLEPQIILITDGVDRDGQAIQAYRQLLALVAQCDYLPRLNRPFAPEFYAASLAAWKDRYVRWVSDPVLNGMYRARTLFDLRPIHGQRKLAQELEAVVLNRVDSSFLHIVADDCLDTLPPLTFFEDAVVDTSGEQTAVFHLEDSALRPLVDVGRVFGLAARAPIGLSTIERFATARSMLPDQQALFREAADTFRVVLWLQGRIGISEGTSGIDLPPSLLSRHDRQILKGGFRSILRLLQFAANPSWLSRVPLPPPRIAGAP